MCELIYGDGSGNTYLIEKGKEITLEYLPIKPRFSSSGIYDGGEHVKKELELSKFTRLRDLFIEATMARDQHVQNRVKMSGMVSMKESDSQQECILAPNSNLKDLIENLLRSLLKG